MSAVVYKHFDVNRKLLYIGSSQNIIARHEAHKDTAHWFKDIACIKVYHYESRSDALLAELYAIIKEKPMYNKCYKLSSFRISELMKISVDSNDLELFRSLHKSE